MIERSPIVLAAVLWTAVSAGNAAGSTGNRALDAIQAVTALRHGDVGHVDSRTLARWLRDLPREVLLLDAREPAEYAVSHLPGAVRVSPDMTAEAFVARFGDRIEGRRIVIYCSVGVRSTGLGSRIGDVAREAGAVSVVNLTGGIFNWHNERRPLVAASGPTERIHPYSELWGRLLERRALISYGPEAAAE